MARQSPGRSRTAGLLAILSAVAVLLGLNFAQSSRALWTSASTSGGNTLSTITVQPATLNTAIAKPGGLIALSWSASPTALLRGVTYSVWRSPAGANSFVRVAADLPATTYTDAPSLDGLYDYEVQVNIATFVSPFSNVVTGRSDSVAPTVSVTCNGTACSSGWYTASPLNVGISASDSGSGLASISYSIDGGSPTTVTGSPASFAVSGDAVHTVTYSATDNAGNVNGPNTLTIHLDTTSPVWSAIAVCDLDGYVIPTKDNWLMSATPRKFRVYGQLADPASGVTSVNAKVGQSGLSSAFVTTALNPVTVGTYTCGGSTAWTWVSPILTDSTVLLPGSNVAWVQGTATNGAGLTTGVFGGTPTAPNISVDATPPLSPGLPSAALGAPGSHALTLNWGLAASDLESGIAGYQVAAYLAGTTTVPPGCAGTDPTTVGGSATSYTWTCLTSGQQYDLLVWASDNAGMNSTPALVTSLTAP